MQARKKSKAKQTPASSTTATKPKAAKAQTATVAKFDNPLNADEPFDEDAVEGDVTPRPTKVTLTELMLANQQILEKTKDLATRTYVMARGLRDLVDEQEKGAARAK